MENKLKTVIDWLKREKVIHTQAEFTEIVGYDRSSISIIANGDKPISHKLAEKISAEFPMISYSWLMGEDTPMIDAGYPLPRQRMTNNYIKGKGNLLANENSSINGDCPNCSFLRDQYDRLQEKYDDIITKYITLLEKKT